MSELLAPFRLLVEKSGAFALAVDWQNTIVTVSLKQWLLFTVALSMLIQYVLEFVNTLLAS